MLQSNTDARCFKLQPAPRPKGKKRPQSCSSPQTPAAASTALPVADRASSNDTCSLRSCFDDDDDAPTPRASEHSVRRIADGTHLASPLSARSGRMSTASTRSSNSVARLLAAMSVSPRDKTSADSPVASVPVVLTTKSPTPSSPLFPRRTLMRSLSATCIHANVRSPSSPLVTSPDAKMRKRMGWRGAMSARMQAETAILMSPGSPLTPRRAHALHTPTQASVAPRDESEKREVEIEPLSATLKRLGAKRRTERFASTCVPVPSPLPEVQSELPEYLTPDTATESWQVMTATRKIFQLPSWVRFEANHHARLGAATDNRHAANEFSKLELSRSSDTEVVAGPGVLPKVSHVGDVAPDSPNGELFAGFDVDVAVAEEKQEPEWVVKVIRPPNMAALRTEKSEAKSSARMIDVLRSALPGLAPQRRIKGCPISPRALRDGDRRDGWGGILTRSSWFPNHAKGPLVSPTPPKRLKKMLLQPEPRMSSDEEWEDIDETATHPVAKSFLELNDAPRFPQPRAAQRWFGLASSQVDKKDWMDGLELDTWRTKRVAPDQVVASELVSKATSVENRPLGKKRASKGWIMAAVAAVIVVAVVANVIAAKTKPVALTGTSVANGLGPATVVKPPAVMDPRQSSVAKAAQLSQS